MGWQGRASTGTGLLPNSSTLVSGMQLAWQVGWFSNQKTGNLIAQLL